MFQSNFPKWAMVLIAALLIVACESDSPKKETTLPILKGAFIVSEGAFNANNGGVGFISEDGTQDVLNLFQQKNGRPIGDIVQSFTIVDTLGFIVVNNSQKVEIVNLKDFSSVAKISDLSYPRFVTKARDGVVYITNGNGTTEGGDKVIVYDYATMEKIGEIAVGRGPEMMAKVGEEVYVTNSGGYQTDRSISVIDVNTDQVVKTIEVGYQPCDVAVDRNQNLWVLCKGGLDPTTWGPLENASLIQIDTEGNEVLKSIDLGGSLSSYGTNLIDINQEGDEILLSHIGLFKIGIDATEFDNTPWVENVASYGMSVDHENGNIYSLHSVYDSVYVYNVNGNLIDRKLTLPNANSVVFNHEDFND